MAIDSLLFMFLPVTNNHYKSFENKKKQLGATTKCSSAVDMKANRYGCFWPKPQKRHITPVTNNTVSDA